MRGLSKFRKKILFGKYTDSKVSRFFIRTGIPCTIDMAIGASLKLYDHDFFDIQCKNSYNLTTNK
jgi:hypothetical protein